MNVAAHALVLSTQRLPSDLRLQAKLATRPTAALEKIRDAQKIAPSPSVASEPKRAERFGERRKPRRAADDSPRSLPQSGDERGRLLDVYC